MSVDYLPRKVVPYDDIMTGKVPGVSVQEAEDPPHPLDEACVLSSSSGYMWARKATNGGATFTVYGGNDADKIIRAIEEHFGTELVSEYDEDFHSMVDSQYRSDFITFEIPEGYLGECARCLRREAKHAIIEKLDTPITTGAEFGLPPVSQVTVHVCDECLRDTDEKA